METIGIVPGGGTTRLPNHVEVVSVSEGNVLSCVELITLKLKVQHRVHFGAESRFTLPGTTDR